MESRIPHDLVGAVRRARVHGLFEGLVDARQQNEDLGLGSLELLGRPAGQRARAVDRVDDGPGERKKRHLVPLERQQRVPSHGTAVVVRLDGTEQDLGFELNDLVAAPIHDSEHQRPTTLDVAVRRDDGAAAEKH